MTHTDHIVALAAAVAATTQTAAEAYALAADIYLGIVLHADPARRTDVAVQAAQAARDAQTAADEANVAYAAYITAQTARAAANEVTP